MATNSGGEARDGGGDGGDGTGATAADAGGWDTRRIVFVVFAVLTVAAVGASLRVTGQSVPPHVYLFGFLGAMVYVFTSLAEKFDEEDRYALEVASKGVAALPLAAGVYLLAFAFPGAGGGDASAQAADRIISGLVFLSGAYVSLTLRALGGLAHRMLGVKRDDQGDSGGGQTRSAAEQGDGDRTEREGDATPGESEDGTGSDGEPGESDAPDDERDPGNPPPNDDAPSGPT